MKVILPSEICLSGKIATQYWKCRNCSTMKTGKEYLCYQKVEAVCDFKLHVIFVLSQAIILSELTHNLMISISICVSNQTWLEPLPCSWRPQAVKSCFKVLHLIFCKIPGSISAKIILQYELLRRTKAFSVWQNFL